MRRFRLKKIAKEIARLEQNILDTADPRIKEKAANDIEKLIGKYNLNLVDLMEIDEMVQNMLQ